MPGHWTDIVTFLKSSDRDHQLRWQDALVAAPTPDSKYLITSPNMNFIPSPVWGHIRVSMKADGKFGMEDPIQYPQMFDKDSHWKFLACAPRVGHRQRRSELWVPPTVDDLNAAGTVGIVGLYTLNRPRLQGVANFIKQLDAEVDQFESEKGDHPHLRWLRLTMHTNFDCLNVPSTRRDVVRQLASVERFCCTIVAWLTWTRLFSTLGDAAPRIPHSDLMGVFTTSAIFAAELYRAGIPVWYMRLMSTITSDVVVVSDTQLQPLDNIVTDSGEFGSTPLYTGFPGRAQHDAIINHSGQAIDIERMAFPSSYAVSQLPAATPRASLSLPASGSSSRTTSREPSSSSSAGPVRNKNWERKGQGKVQPYHRPALPRADPNSQQKFSDPVNPCVTPLLDGWLPALKESIHALRPSTDSWALWVPEPMLLLGSTSEDRRMRYVKNWLTIRESWFYFLRDSALRPSMMARWWRSLLDSGLYPIAKPVKPDDHDRAMRVINSAFQQSGLVRGNPIPLWQGSPVSAVNISLCRQVAWELSEMGFRVEFTMLDRAILEKRFENRTVPAQVATQRDEWIGQIFSSSTPLHFASFPTEATGLGSLLASERAKSLEGLRRLMLSWPGCPEAVKSSGDLVEAKQSVVDSVEPILKQFYATTFVKVANRAPTLPRQCPVLRPPQSSSSSSALPPLPPSSSSSTLPPPPPPPSSSSSSSSSLPALLPVLSSPNTLGLIGLNSPDFVPTSLLQNPSPLPTLPLSTPPSPSAPAVTETPWPSPVRRARSRTPLFLSSPPGSPDPFDEYV